MSRTKLTTTTLAAALALFFAASATTPARADTLGSAQNWLGNVLFGWTDCFRAVSDELDRAASRAYVGVLVTVPTSCGANLAVRYLGNAADVAVVPLTGKNVVSPPVSWNSKPPVRLE